MHLALSGPSLKSTELFGKGVQGNPLPGFLTFSHNFNRVTARPVAKPKRIWVCLISCLGCVQAHPYQPASQVTSLGTLKLWLKVRPGFQGCPLVFHLSLNGCLKLH